MLESKVDNEPVNPFRITDMIKASIQTKTSK